MNRIIIVVGCALLSGAAACVTEPGDELELGDAESELGSKKKKQPPPAPPPAPAPAESPTSGTGGFIDACLLPGMTKVTFNPTSTFDAHDEGVTGLLNLPFAFTFYGVSHTKFWLTTNGQLGFGHTLGGSAFGQASCPLADPRFTTPILLVYSADLIGRLDAGAGVCVGTTGTAPNRKLVATWKDSFFYDAWLTSNVTFSAILNETTNVIQVAIHRVDAPTMPDFESGWGSVLGKQSGTSASSFSCSQQNAPEGTLVQYNP